VPRTGNTAIYGQPMLPPDTAHPTQSRRWCSPTSRRDQPKRQDARITGPTVVSHQPAPRVGATRTPDMHSSTSKTGAWVGICQPMCPERKRSPPAPSPLLRPGAWIGVSEIGHDEVEMVGVLPTLLPKRRNAEPVKNQKVTICRETFDAPDRIEPVTFGFVVPSEASLPFGRFRGFPFGDWDPTCHRMHGGWCGFGPCVLPSLLPTLGVRRASGDSRARRGRVASRESSAQMHQPALRDFTQVVRGTLRMCDTAGPWRVRIGSSRTAGVCATHADEEVGRWLSPRKGSACRPRCP
jgi:hypothetical protein